MAERGTPTFYREHAERLTKLAVETLNPALRLELLEIATAFQKLATHAIANADVAKALADPKSA
jgi:hypothetical protein